MNLESIASSITIKESPFYKNEIIRPFIDAFLLKPELVKGDKRCHLLNQYIFGDHHIEQLKKYPTYGSSHVDIFIGYRFLSRKYRPFFLSLSKYDKKEFEITGYSTLMDEDLISRPYYSRYEILPTFTNWNFDLKISGEGMKFHQVIPKDQLKNSIYESLKKIAKKTQKRNETIMEKMKN